MDGYLTTDIFAKTKNNSIGRIEMRIFKALITQYITGNALENDVLKRAALFRH